MGSSSPVHSYILHQMTFMTSPLTTYKEGALVIPGSADIKREQKDGLEKNHDGERKSAMKDRVRMGNKQNQKEAKMR